MAVTSMHWSAWDGRWVGGAGSFNRTTAASLVVVYWHCPQESLVQAAEQVRVMYFHV